MPPLRARRSCLAVPGSSTKMLGKAQGLPADQVHPSAPALLARIHAEAERKAIGFSSRKLRKAIDPGIGLNVTPQGSIIRSKSSGQLR